MKPGPRRGEPVRVGRRPPPAADEPAATERGNRRGLARLLTAVENDPAAAAEIVHRVWAQTGGARRIGVTGPPGVGKSTLVDHLIALARADGYTVAVVAVDPSSPFSGGAILGDRVRMLRHSSDPGVYVRSMAARDHLGGLAAATRDVAYVLDAHGFGLLLLETVGVGQGELGIMRVADTVVVTTAPAMGDSIQTLKAGIMEIADLLVVNKADRPGAREAVIQLREMRHLGPKPSGWDVPILSTVANEGTGLPELWQAIQRHWAYLRTSGELDTRRAERAERDIMDLVEQALAARVHATLGERDPLGKILQQAKDRTLDPHTAANAIIDRLFPDSSNTAPGASSAERKTGREG